MKNKDNIQEEALKIIRLCTRCGVGITMGGGKTLLALIHMEENLTINSKFLVVIPKKVSITEWKSEAIKHNKEYLIDKMVFTTYLSIKKQDLNNYQVIYLDECHNLKANHNIYLDSYRNKILGLTGTPPKFQNSEKGKMVDKYCPIVYDYTLDEAVDDKLLNDYRIIALGIDLKVVKDLKVTKGNSTWFTSEQDSYNYWTSRIDTAESPKSLQIARIMRMKALMSFPSKESFVKALMARHTEKTIIFANTKDQADKLCNYSYHSGNKSSKENLIKFKSGEINQLSCVLQLSEGVNIPDLKVGIIMHLYSDGSPKSKQRFGRLMRLSTNEVCTLYVLYYKNTIDEDWVRGSLDNFDPDKITWRTFN